MTRFHVSLPIFVALLGTILDLPTLGAQQSVTLAGHEGGTFDAGFSRDGTRMITLGSDGFARVWSSATGREISRLGPLGSVVSRSRAFLDEHGEYALTYSGIGVVRWHVHSGRAVDTLEAPSSVVELTSEYGTDLVAASHSHGVRFFHPAGEETPEDLGRSSEGLQVLGASFDPAGDEGVLAQYDIYVYPDDPPEAQQHAILFSEISGGRLVSDYSMIPVILPANTFLLRHRPGDVVETAFVAEGAVHLGFRPEFSYDTAPLPAEVKSLWAGTGLHRLEYAPDGSRLALMWSDSVGVFDAETGEQQEKLYDVRMLVWSPDGAVRGLVRTDGSIQLTGVLPDREPRPIYLDYSSHHFGDLRVGERRTDTLHDFARNVDVVPHSLKFRLDGVTTAGIFEVEPGTGGTTLPPGETVDLVLTFTPQSRGARSVSVETDIVDRGSVAPLEVTGTGLSPYFQPGETEYELERASDPRTGLVFAGNRYLLKPDEGELKTWDSRYGNVVSSDAGTYIGHVDGGRYMVIGRSSSRELIDVETYTVTQRYPPFPATVVSPAIRRRGDSIDLLFASPLGSRPQTMYFYDTRTGKAGAVSVPMGDVVSTTYTMGLSFSDDGTMLVAGGSHGEVIVFDAENRSFAWQFRTELTHPPHALFDPSGEYVVAQISDAVVALLDARSGTVRRELIAHRRTAVPVEFSPDGSRLLTVGADSTARIWNIETGELLLTIDSPYGEVLSATFSPDGARLAIRPRNRYVASVHDAETGEELAYRPGVHGLSDPLNKDLTIQERRSIVRFSPDGTRIAVILAGVTIMLGPEVAAPYLSIDRDEIDLTQLSVASDTTVTVTVTNTGPYTLDLQPKLFPPTDAFRLVEPGPIQISSGATKEVAIEFHPSMIEQKGERQTASAATVETVLGFMYGEGGSMAHVTLGGESTITTHVETTGGPVDDKSTRRLRGFVEGEMGSWQIDLSMQRPDVVSVDLYDIRGNKVRSLLQAWVSAGESRHSVNINDVPAGTYFLVLTSGSHREVVSTQILQ